MRVEIPGWKTLELKNLVLDMNGTIAVDGIISTRVKAKVNKLADTLSIYLLSADTYGTLESQAKGLKADISKIASSDEAREKAFFVHQLGAEQTVVIGNGANDALMLREATLGIVVLGVEGAAVESIREADLVTLSPEDALDLLLNPTRLKATLRR